MTWGQTMGDIAARRISGTTGAQGTEPPDNDDMEDRVAKLEDFAIDTRDRLARIETKLDAFPSIFATKADLQEMGSNLIKWMVGTAAGLGVAAITVMTFVLNNAAPKAPSVQAPPNIIINVPASAAPAAPASK